MMTDEQVKQGFDEVYNQFWRRHKEAIPQKYAEEEWEAIHSQMLLLQEKYPFLSQALVSMEIELDERMRRRERNCREL